MAVDEHDSAPRARIAAYLRQAESARLRALAAADPQTKESWELLADNWQDLAEQVARSHRLK